MERDSERIRWRERFRVDKMERERERCKDDIA